MKRILIVEDHAIVRRGLVQLLADNFPQAVFGEAGDAWQALKLVAGQLWDIALVDISMPRKSGLELLKELKSHRPRLPVLVLSAHPEDQFGVRVLRAGAAGYMTKESAPEELVVAIRRILGGKRYISPSLAERLADQIQDSPPRPPHESLSDREYEVFRAIASGKTVSQIAGQLGLSPKTVSTYRARILEKMGLRNNAELMQYAMQNALVGVDR